MSAQHRYRPGHPVPSGLLIYRCTRTEPVSAHRSRFLRTGRVRVVVHDGSPALPRFSGELPLDESPNPRPCDRVMNDRADGSPAASGVGEFRRSASAATATATRYVVRWLVS